MRLPVLYLEGDALKCQSTGPLKTPPTWQMPESSWGSFPTRWCSRAPPGRSERRPLPALQVLLASRQQYNAYSWILRSARKIKTLEDHVLMGRWRVNSDPRPGSECYFCLPSSKSELFLILLSDGN